MNLCPRKSVGAVIKDNQDRYLCLYRLGVGQDDPTRGLAFVAGHLDFMYEDEDVLELPATALVREVKEESKLRVVDCKQVLQATYPNPCSKGYNAHEWFIFKATCTGRLPWRPPEPAKHAWLRYLSVDEIKAFVKAGHVDPAWAEHIWPALGII